MGPQGTPPPRPRLYPYGLCGCLGCWPEGGKQQKGWKERDPLSCLCPSSFLFRSRTGSAPVRTHIAGRRGSVGSGPGDVCNSVIVNPDPQEPPEVSHPVPPHPCSHTCSHMAQHTHVLSVHSLTKLTCTVLADMRIYVHTLTHGPSHTPTYSGLPHSAHGAPASPGLCHGSALMAVCLCVTACL